MPGGGACAGELCWFVPGGVKIEIFCFLPFSSSVKSSGFRPVSALPFLSVTTTSTTTSRVLVRMVMVGSSPGGCCAMRIVEPAVKFRIKAEVITMRKGKLRNIEPPKYLRPQRIIRNVPCFRAFGKHELPQGRRPYD